MIDYLSIGRKPLQNWSKYLQKIVTSKSHLVKRVTSIIGHFTKKVSSKKHTSEISNFKGITVEWLASQNWSIQK